jgi:L-threonylcarbamoyladenylate synthase
MRVFHTASLSEREFDLILAVLRAGGVIGFPTDTAYGLAADPFNNEAIATIFKLKGRPENKPILLLVDSLEMAKRVTRPNPSLDDVAHEFWPGPLTIILPAIDKLPEAITAGTGGVGVRWPVAPFATELVRRFGNPITATSANKSGEPTCVTAAEVEEQLGSPLEFLVDGGELPARSGSTVLDLTNEPPQVLREGPVSFERLRSFFKNNVRRRPE